MVLFHHESDEADAHAQVTVAQHTAHFSHELIAAAASYEAAKAYEDHLTKNGKLVSHAKAKEFLAGAAGFFVDRLVETKGLDYVSAQKAKHAAKENLDNVSAPHYED